LLQKKRRESFGGFAASHYFSVVSRGGKRGLRGLSAAFKRRDATNFLVFFYYEEPRRMRESKRDSEMFFRFSFLYCISAVNRNGAAVNYRETERDGECFS
jgi:hypothetical protein